MKNYHHKGISFLFLLCFTIPLCAEEAYWQCLAKDREDKNWLGIASFERTAKQKALDSCKKESIFPTSCQTASTSCIPPYNYDDKGHQKSLWHCTALDRSGTSWTSDRRSNRDEAALSAEAYCRSKSTIPKTCYVNMVTCRKRGS